jgi:hypothetical protein
MCTVGHESTQAYVKQGLSTEVMQESCLHSLKMRTRTTIIIIILCWCHHPVWVSVSPPWFPNSKCFQGHNGHAQHGGPGTALYLAPYLLICLAWVELPKAYSCQHRSPGHRPLRHKAMVLKELSTWFIYFLMFVSQAIGFMLDTEIRLKKSNMYLERRQFFGVLCHLIWYLLNTWHHIPEYFNHNTAMTGCEE